MTWEPSALLRLVIQTRFFGRFPGDTLFLLLSAARAPAMLVLSPDGRKALIPACYLVPVGQEAYATR